MTEALWITPAREAGFGYRERMLRRRLIASAVAAVAAWSLVGCADSGVVPTPTPTLTVLTDEEAYSGAEVAFRAYVDAINDIDVDDPATFEPAFELTTGELNSFDRQQYSQWHADGWVETGSVLVSRLDRSKLLQENTSVQLTICLDVSSVQLMDKSGQSQVSSDRPKNQPLYATVKLVAEKWLVENLFGRADGVPC